MSERARATPRVREHVDKLREAGLDTQQFFDALIGIRDDTALPRGHKEAIYKLLAMESFVWYLEALRDEQIDRVKLRDEVNQIAAEYDAAIRKQQPGEKAAVLAQKDIGAGPKKRKRPPGAKGPGDAKRRAGAKRPSAPQSSRPSAPQSKRPSAPPNATTVRERDPTKATPRKRPPAASPAGPRPSGAPKAKGPPPRKSAPPNATTRSERPKRK